MSLTKEQIKELKQQLHNQIKRLPLDQRKEAEKQIEYLSDEAIEEMLENQKESQQSIFREIIQGVIPSKKIDENSSAIAVLEIKPVSKGHTIIVPKEKITDQNKIPKEIQSFAEKTAENISKKLNAKQVKIIPETKFGEVVINIIPIYTKDLSLESERSNTSNEQLDSLVTELTKKEEVPTKEEKQEIKKLSRRIP